MIKEKFSQVQEAGRKETMKRSEVCLHTMDCPFPIEPYRSCLMIVTKYMIKCNHLVHKTMIFIGEESKGT